MGTALHAYDGMLGLFGCTASQITLLQHTGCSAEQTHIVQLVSTNKIGCFLKGKKHRVFRIVVLGIWQLCLW